MCPDGFTGIDCSPISEDDGPSSGMIFGIVGGVIGLIIILAIIIVILIVKRPEKRHGSNFIPLEKKDFTKIIYGDQLNQTPDKSAGDIKELERVSRGLDGLTILVVSSG